MAKQTECLASNLSVVIRIQERFFSIARVIGVIVKEVLHEQDSKGPIGRCPHFFCHGFPSILDILHNQ